jgi:hypothetical protein
METQNKSLKDVIKEEYKKCAGDPVYFMKKYCKIQHPTRGKIRFELFPFQEKTLQQFEKNRFNIVLKSRQTGISTLTAGFSLWSMIFNQDFNVLVIAIKQEVAKNLVTKVRVMYDGLPSWLKVNCEEDNKLSLRLVNGSQIKAIASSPEAGRSEALSLLVFDEAAFIDDIDSIWTAATPALSTGGSCIALSTPNGVGNWFHKQWMGAEEGTNEFTPIKLHWTIHPERDQKWRDEQTNVLGEKLASQECDCDFVSSGNTVIDSQYLMWFKETFVKEPVEKTGFDGNYWKWEYPDYNKSYMVSADVARGDSSDFSAFHVFDIINNVQVAEYKGKIDTKDFGNMLVAVATEWNNALLVVENANVGWAALQQCIDRGYQNIYYQSQDYKYVDVERQYSNKLNAEERREVAGFTTSTRSRPLIISKLDEYFKSKEVVIQSIRLIDELFTFIWNGSRAEAMRGYNDDLVMSFSIGLWVRDTALRLRQERMDLTKQSISSFSTTGISMGNGYQSNRFRSNPYQMDIGKNTEDIKWLLG